jgi:ABC-type Fe3+ transport system permease subunit
VIDIPFRQGTALSQASGADPRRPGWPAGPSAIIFVLAAVVSVAIVACATFMGVTIFTLPVAVVVPDAFDYLGRSIIVAMLMLSLTIVMALMFVFMLRRVRGGSIIIGVTVRRMFLM